MQGTFQGTFRDIQGTFRHIQGTFTHLVDGEPEEVPRNMISMPVGFEKLPLISRDCFARCRRLSFAALSWCNQVMVLK
jgi:hypothetical protein